MVNTRVLVAFLAGAAMVLSGCISGGTDDAAPNEADDVTQAKETDSALPGFQVDMQNCREGGGVSVYNSEPGASGPAPPLTRADISDLVGNPMIGTYFQPVTSDHTTGIWHISMYCEEHQVSMPDAASSGSMGGHGHETAAQDPTAAESADHHGPLYMGWVGVRIDPPEWDDSGIEHQFFIPDISFMNKQIVDVLREDLLIHASLMLDGKIDWVGPAAVHQVMDDEDHGVFQTHATMEEYKDLEIEKMRFWIYVDMTGNYNYGHDHDEAEDASPGHGYMPVAIDLVNTGGGTHYTSVDGLAWLSHTRTNHHGAAGGAAGNTAAVLFDGFDRTLTIGATPDVHLNETWLH